MSFSPEELKYWRGIYIQHRAQCGQRGIGFDLTFEEWLDVWTASGLIKERGRTRNGAVMGRKDKTGAFTVDNVEITRAWKNMASRDFTSNRKRIVTPAGEFDSVKEASEYYGVTPGAISQRLTAKKPGYGYLD